MTPNVCRVGQDGDVRVDSADSRLIEAVRRCWDTRFAAAWSSGKAGVHVSVDRQATPHPQGYRIDVRPDRVMLTGGSPAGCFYGLQTLGQLEDLHAGAIPCCIIEDWPDFTTRGLLHDVTRGKVPTLGTLKLIVDRLASLKANQLQLYIEHAFVFSFDPEICDADHGLTPDEIRELDGYCRERFIDLVPALATFGHMGRILSMPKYRHLAEVEATESWEAMSWPQRVRGLTLDCTDPEAHRLVERMWSDVLDAFSSPVVNICGDEPWDLGEGKNRERFAVSGKGAPYIEQIRRTYEICARRGRRMQLWSDIIRKYPDVIDRLPRDVTILHWGYDDRADYDGTELFTNGSLDTVVCPGTSGWKRIINAVDLAERNIARFAAAGSQYGASGLLNTDWGDHGHFNLLACSWHGIALGAALGWSADHPTGRRFDGRFARHVLGLDVADGIHLLRRVSQVAESCETWRFLWTPLRDLADDSGVTRLLDSADALKDVARLSRWCREDLSRDALTAADLTELEVAARFTELFIGKVAALATSSSTNARAQWADALMEAGNAYADCWQRRNKPSGLDDILGALELAAGEVRSARSKEPNL